MFELDASDRDHRELPVFHRRKSHPFGSTYGIGLEYWRRLGLRRGPGARFIALGVITIVVRRETSVSLGSGDSDRLLRRIRVHANFAEYVPFALILVAGTAIAGAPGWFLHLSCFVLIVGRLVHAAAIQHADGRLRAAGMGATPTVLGAAALFDLAAVAVA